MAVLKADTKRWPTMPAEARIIFLELVVFLRMKKVKWSSRGRAGIQVNACGRSFVIRYTNKTASFQIQSWDGGLGKEIPLADPKCSPKILKSLIGTVAAFRYALQRQITECTEFERALSGWSEWQ